jgi:hypothetical protein
MKCCLEHLKHARPRVSVLCCPVEALRWAFKRILPDLKDCFLIICESIQATASDTWTLVKENDFNYFYALHQNRNRLSLILQKRREKILILCTTTMGCYDTDGKITCCVTDDYICLDNLSQNSPISNLFKIGLSILELFYAYGQTNGRSHFDRRSSKVTNVPNRIK